MSTRVQLIGDNSVDSGSIVNATIKTEDILDSAVTTAKLAPGVAIPTGVIVMWSGSVASIPSGWTLCNGANGTPDLRDRFVVGAGSGYNPGNTGGSNSVTLTTNQMPSHNHSASDSGHSHQLYNQIGGAGNSVGGGGSNTSDQRTGTGYANITVGYAGGGQAHENRPPYYALAYIMKS